MLIGTLTNFGSYDECVDTTVKNNHGVVLMSGQYCSIKFRPPLPSSNGNFKLGEIPYMLRNISQKGTIISEFAKHATIFKVFPMQLGICVPSGCEVEDIEKLTKLVSDFIYFDTSVSRCQMKEKLKLNKAEIISIVICVIFGSLVFVGTFMDAYSSKMKVIFTHRGAQVLMAFSYHRNVKKLLQTDNNSGVLGSLHGIRFLTIAWILLTHTYFLLYFPSVDGLTKIEDYGKSFAFQAIINGTYAVETFFFIGGLLLSYILASKGQRTINIGYYILHRIWRILPLSTAAIMFIILVRLFGSGPVWHESIDAYLEDCYNNWWKNLIFINNFHKPENSCLPHTWYIACDMQMYIAALIILLPLLKWPVAGLFLGFLGLFGSIFYSGINTYIRDLPPTMLLVDPDPSHYKYYWNVHFFQPFPHAGSYCIGILVGYLLATKPKLKMSWKVQVLGWCLSFICCISTLFGAQKWNSGEAYTTTEAVAYASLSKQTWALGMAWVVICCVTGHGGIVNTILSWKAFVPLGRLTFAVYLLHPIVQAVFMGNKTTLTQPDHFIIVYYFFGHLIVTFVLGAIISMIFEAPFMNLEKILFFRSESTVAEKATDALKGSLQTDKNGSISTVVPTDINDAKINETNGDIVYKL
ncbi:nose resistant to fluoxetine protein 6-like [Stegodyphus dumicola]|uniref:nose resistant to fluoxetine protein 6-like n=1 Tax=Stegodyphus dumicola TaxID=202533 RepID=UPI0015AC90FA|nr:nose resistant to fluoxetine protein 6-like [Stegodyphus dumicola]